MGRTAGTPNKITAEVRGKLENLIEGIVSDIDLAELTASEKIKLLQISLQYTLPRLQAMVIKEEREDVPLFVDIIERKPDSDEEVWADNFHIKERIKY
jgi:hypothetical protein